MCVCVWGGGGGGVDILATRQVYHGDRTEQTIAKSNPARNTDPDL